MTPLAKGTRTRRRRYSRDQTELGTLRVCVLWEMTERESGLFPWLPVSLRRSRDLPLIIAKVLIPISGLSTSPAPSLSLFLLLAHCHAAILNRSAPFQMQTWKTVDKMHLSTTPPCPFNLPCLIPLSWMHLQGTSDFRKYLPCQRQCWR